MIRIDAAIAEQLAGEALRTFPDECCAFLFGSGDERARTESVVLPVDNVKEGDKRRRFAITARDYLRAERYADEHGIALIGIYHSHPEHPAIPSEHDRAAAQPYFSYVIASVHEGAPVTFRSWRLNDDARFEEETITGAVSTESSGAHPVHPEHTDLKTR